jgi:hypothetical protein
VIVAVPADEIVDVVAVRDRVVAAARAVRVTLRVSVARVRRRAVRGIACVDSDRALVDVTIVRAVKVPVVRVAGVSAVRDRGVPAAGAVGVVALLVDLAAAPDRYSVGYGSWGGVWTCSGSLACSRGGRTSSRTWSSASE